MKAIQTIIINYVDSEEPILEFYDRQGKKRDVSIEKSGVLMSELETIYESIKEPEDLLLEKEIELNERETLLIEKSNSLEEKRIQTIGKLENIRDTLVEFLTEDQLEFFLFLYDEWEVGIEYFTGDKVSYNNKLYSVIQPHTSQENWTPENAPALFKRTVSDNIIQDWYQPAGAHDAFNEGDLILFEDRVYQVKEGNYGVTWSPLITPALWEDLGTLEEYNASLNEEEEDSPGGQTEPVEDPEEPIEDPEEPIENPEEPIEDPEEPVEDPEEPTEDPEDELGSAANPYTYAPYNGIPHGQEGSQGVYNTGEHVLFNDTLYKSLIDNNTWAPDAYPAGWEKV